jgi:hypothetical protein
MGGYDWFAHQSDSTATSPAASTGVAAVQWFGLLTRDTSHNVFEDHVDTAPTPDAGFLDSLNSRDGDNDTPLQRATKTIDGQPTDSNVEAGKREEDMWQSSESITLLEREQVLFANFLHRICSWVRYPLIYMISNGFIDG